MTVCKGHTSNTIISHVYLSCSQTKKKEEKEIVEWLSVLWFVFVTFQQPEMSYVLTIIRICFPPFSFLGKYFPSSTAGASSWKARKWSEVPVFNGNYDKEKQSIRDSSLHCPGTFAEFNANVHNSSLNRKDRDNLAYICTCRRKGKGCCTRTG